MPSSIISQSVYAKIINRETGEVVSAASLDALCAWAFGVGAASAVGEARFSAGVPTGEQAPTSREAASLSNVSYLAAASKGRWKLPDSRHKLTAYAGCLTVEEVREAVVSRADKEAAAKEREEAGEAREWKRGKVSGFSAGSRRRMTRMMAKVRGLERAYFCTLTLNDASLAMYRRADGSLDAASVGRAINTARHAFDKRMQRALSGPGWQYGGIWRVEFQRRKSGEYLGQLVPHLHVVLLGVPEKQKSALRKLIGSAWSGVQGVKTRVQVDPVRSRRHAMYYVSKYVSKLAEDGEDNALEAGRRWGIVGEVDTSGVTLAELSAEDWAKLRRYLARWVAGRSSRAKRYAASMRRGLLGWSVFVFGGGFEEASAGLPAALLASIAI